MSSYLVSASSLSPDGLTYLLVVVLLSRGVLAELRAEETRLCSAGLLVVPSVLATRAPVSSARLTAPPLLPTPSGGVSRPLYAEKSK